jgi:hypothetical protein
MPRAHSRMHGPAFGAEHLQSLAVDSEHQHSLGNSELRPAQRLQRHTNCQVLSVERKC